MTKRQPEGTPTGGQFAADRKDEPSGGLSTGAPGSGPGSNYYAARESEADYQEQRGGHQPNAQKPRSLVDRLFRRQP